jgi:hypothetical protein
MDTFMIKQKQLRGIAWNVMQVLLFTMNPYTY